MNTKLTMKWSVWLIGGLFALFGSTAVFANAGDTVSNLATINYSVGGVAQTLIESSPTGNSTPGATQGTSTDFIEDRLINFTVVESGTIGYNTASPGQTGAALQFTVTNNSNQVLDFLLAAIDTDLDTHNGGAADNFDITTPQVFVEDGTTVGFQPAEDTGVFADEIAADGGTQIVYIVGTIPAGATNGQTSGYALVAQVAAGGAAAAQGLAIMRDDNGNVSPAGTYSNGGTPVLAGAPSNIADVVGTMQTVFNDPAGVAAEDEGSNGAQDTARNGQAADSDAFQVNAAALTVTKTSAVISDPVNGVTNPKAIPGAIVEYTVTIANAAGAGAADSIVISDSLNNQIAVLQFINWVTNSMIITAPTINGGAPQALGDSNVDGDEGEFVANVITARCGTLTATQSCTLVFRVTVQ